MSVFYADQARKLDIRQLMAMAFNSGRAENYSLRYDLKDWPSIAGLKKGERGDQITATITLDRSPEGPATGPILGHMLISFLLPDGHRTGQWLLLKGSPSTARSWRWKANCPMSGDPVQVLYFNPSLRRFVSRKASGAKTRRRPGKSRSFRRRLNRMHAYMREIEVCHAGPNIIKPLWMTEARFYFLKSELVKEHIHCMSLVLKMDPPDFGEEERDLDLGDIDRKPMPVNDPASMSMYFRDKDGVLQIKAKFKRQHGLPVEETEHFPKSPR